METDTSTAVDVAATLVFVQGAIAAVSTLEALVAGLAGFGTLIPAVLTFGLTAALLYLSRRLRRRSRRARRATVIIEVLVLVWAAIDLALALLLAHMGLGLVPTVTRMVLPVAVLRLVRRPGSRVEFGMTPEGATT